MARVSKISTFNLRFNHLVGVLSRKKSNNILTWLKITRDLIISVCTADLLRAAGGGGREEERVRDRRLRRGGAHGGHAHRGGGHQEEEQQIPPAPGTAPPGLCTLCNAHSPGTLHLHLHLHLHTTAQTRLLTS